jgi:hypothetical protein
MARLAAGFAALEPSLHRLCWFDQAKPQSRERAPGAPISASLRLTKRETIVAKASAPPLDFTREPQYDRFAGGSRSWPVAKNALPTDG